MPSTDDVRLSRRLSLVLRHRPDSVGVELDSEGWVDVDDLVAALAGEGRGPTRADVARVVAASEKQRFEWDDDANRIRARQGHSVTVDLALEPVDPPDALFHGTPSRNLASILRTGLDRRRRHHVHLSGDESTARAVGERRGPCVVLVVDAGGMSRAGHTCYRSSNGVWLTDQVPPRFIRAPKTGSDRVDRA